ncbi:MAG: hypothetical protein HN744_07605 [Halieaceae bacterium]|nr:hypothetical protein [Halieaceae bacterium]MBT6125327.1 hypothetical protein [Halieaceae bacterium]MBT7719246.1 hypothetical protein [Halieaceae bacterium]
MTKDSVDALRETGPYLVLTPDELVTQAKALGENGAVMLHPMAGGTDPDLSWEMLELVESKVMPHLA